LETAWGPSALALAMGSASRWGTASAKASDRALGEASDAGLVAELVDAD
jgi:hypothetical protein